MSEDTQKNETPVQEVRENHRKVRVGTVVSDKQDKTRVVVIVRSAPDPLYKKVVKHTKKCYVHDENNESKVGDVVKIMETRRLSKMKRWRLVEIQKHAATD